MYTGKFQAHHLLPKEVKMKKLSFKLCLEHDPMCVSLLAGTDSMSLAVRTLHSTAWLLSPGALSKILYLKPLWISNVCCEQNLPFQWRLSSEPFAFCGSCSLETCLLCSAQSQNSLLFLLSGSFRAIGRAPSSSPSLCVVCCFLQSAVFIVMVNGILIFGKLLRKTRPYPLCGQLSLQVLYTLIYCCTRKRMMAYRHIFNKVKSTKQVSIPSLRTTEIKI